METTTVTLDTWGERAACAGLDPEVFFPLRGGDDLAAKQVCAGCEVRAECLETALVRREQHGVWGGLNATERRRLRRHTPTAGRRHLAVVGW